MIMWSRPGRKVWQRQMIIKKHARPNAMIPMVTWVVSRSSAFLGGVVITETRFSTTPALVKQPLTQPATWMCDRPRSGGF